MSEIEKDVVENVEANDEPREYQNIDNLKEVIKAILFVSGDGVDISDIIDKLNVEPVTAKQVIDEMINDSKQDEMSGVQLIHYNNKIQLASNPKYKQFVEEVLNPIKEKMLTKKVLEVCAIIAYKQPITRLEIDEIRGMNSDYSVDVLLDNNLIEVVGRKDAVGKPLLFGTTDNFLKKFGLTSINDLPDYETLLERIKVVKETKDTSMLFNYTDYTANADESNIQTTTQEQLSEEEQNQILDAIQDIDNNTSTYEIDIHDDDDQFV